MIGMLGMMRLTNTSAIDSESMIKVLHERTRRSNFSDKYPVPGALQPLATDIQLFFSTFKLCNIF